MAIAYHFSSFACLILQAYSFCSALVSPQHPCLPVTASQREVEMNTSHLYSSGNLWRIGRELSIPTQQPHVQEGSDPRLSAHCIFETV